jgi:hypothetical protein
MQTLSLLPLQNHSIVVIRDLRAQTLVVCILLEFCQINRMQIRLHVFNEN